MIEVNGLVVERGGCRVVDQVSFAAADGRVLAIVGPNGSGKSSLVGAIGSDLACAAGTVFIDSCDVATASAQALARLRAILTQEVAVSVGFTVREVVAFGRSPWRGTAEMSMDERAVSDALRALDLVPLESRPVQSLSGGEQARVAMARVLAQQTPNVILDEPTAALDLRHQHELLAQASRHASSGGCAIIVIHDLMLAAQYADDVLVMSRGVAVAAGEPAQVLVPEVLEPVYQLPIATLTNPYSNRPIVLAR